MAYSSCETTLISDRAQGSLSGLSPHIQAKKNPPTGGLERGSAAGDEHQPSGKETTDDP